MVVGNPTQMFLFIDCVSKTTVLYRNEIWVCEKTQAFCYCFHNYRLGDVDSVGRTDIVNFDITDGGPAQRRRRNRQVLLIKNRFPTSIKFIKFLPYLSSIHEKANCGRHISKRWAAHRQTAILFIVFGIQGLRFLTAQFVVWEPRFNIFWKRGELGYFARCGQFTLPKLEKFGYILIT